MLCCLAKSNRHLRARGGLIDHQPGDQVGNQSRLVSCDPQKSDPSSDISAITPPPPPLRAECRPVRTPAGPPVQLLIPSIYTPSLNITLQEP